MVRAVYILKVGVACLLACLGTCGCGSKPVPKQRPLASSQLLAIGLAYLEATDNQDRPPQNKEELVPYLKLIVKDPDNKDDPGKAMTPAEILRSPNDDEEFVIHWGVDYRNYNLSGQPNKLPVFAYEKRGKDGKRLVLQAVRHIRLVTDEQLANLPFPPGTRAP